MKKLFHSPINTKSRSAILIVASLLVFVLALLTPLPAQAVTPQNQPTNTTQNNSTTNTTNQNSNSQSSQSGDGSDEQSTQEQAEQSCDAAAGALSFFLCPVYEQLMDMINWMAGPEDSILTSLLRVDPLQFNADEGLLRAYRNVLNFANSLFIIVFLVIIFAGFISDFEFLEGYTFKRTFPRLLAAVILAQFGYLICAIAIDIGNVLGTFAPNLIVSGVLGPNVAVPTLAEGVTGLLAFGNPEVVGGGTAALLFGASGTVVFFVLLAMVILAAFALFIALIYMVVRYLVLIILIFAAPIAFVAWVLPGTEGFFFKWGKTLIQLVLMFPLVAIVITTAEVASFLLLHPTLNPTVFTTNKAHLLIGGLMPLVALLLIPKCLKLSGDIVSFAGGAATGYLVGKGKDGAGKVRTAGVEGMQNRIASNDDWNKTSIGRFVVAGAGGLNRKSPKGAAKMGQVRDRSQSVFDKAADLGTSDELKSMVKQNYRPAKIAGLTALAKNGDRAAVKEALTNPSYGFDKSILKAATTKDYSAFDKMPDLRNVYDSPADQANFFTNMNAKTFGDVSAGTMKEWVGNEITLPNGQKRFQIDSAKLSGKFSSAQMQGFLNDKNVRAGMSEDIRREFAQYGYQGNSAIQQSIRSNIDNRGSWI